MPFTFISISRTILSNASLYPHQVLPVDGVAPASQKKLKTVRIFASCTALCPVSLQSISIVRTIRSYLFGGPEVFCEYPTTADFRKMEMTNAIFILVL
jgi:hypothetical protein